MHIDLDTIVEFTFSTLCAAEGLDKFKFVHGDPFFENVFGRTNNINKFTTL